MIRLRKQLRWYAYGSVLLLATELSAQTIRIDPASAAARAALRSTPANPVSSPLLISTDTIAPRRLSRGAATALGFLGGAAAGLFLAHVVNQGRGEGRLENYLAIPPALGLFTAATVFVAMGD